MTVFGDRIRSLRISKKLAQKEVASWLGVSDSSVRKYESGDRTPPPEAISILADKFGVSSDYLLGVSDIKTQPSIPKEIAISPNGLINALYPDEPEIRDILISSNISADGNIVDKDGNIIINTEDKALLAAIRVLLDKSLREAAEELRKGAAENKRVSVEINFGEKE